MRGLVNFLLHLLENDTNLDCMSALLEQALKLPIPERRKLADDIYDSIDLVTDEFYLTDEQKAELDRRVADARENPDKLIPWEVVRERLRKIG